MFFPCPLREIMVSQSAYSFCYRIRESQRKKDQLTKTVLKGRLQGAWHSMSEETQSLGSSSVPFIYSINLESTDDTNQSKM